MARRRKSGNPSRLLKTVIHRPNQFKINRNNNLMFIKLITKSIDDRQTTNLKSDEKLQTKSIKVNYLKI